VETSARPASSPPTASCYLQSDLSAGRAAI
jgi:hypothetical protein